MKNIARSTKAEIAHSEIGWMAIWLMQTVMETPTTDAEVSALLVEMLQRATEIARPYTHKRTRRGLQLAK